MENKDTNQGHPVITREAVHRLFSEFPAGGKVLGQTEAAFFSGLDKGQKYADGWFRRNPIGGDTWHACDLNPDAQRKHAMADPSKTGEQNLQDARTFIAKQLALAVGARIERSAALEWQYLGAAIHAIQDSYSNAHTFRNMDNPGDPRAAIEAIFTFYLLDTTHTSEFDKTNATDDRLNRAGDQAAVSASFEVLKLYLQVLNAGGTFDENVETFLNFVSEFLQGPDAKVMRDRLSPEFLREKSKRYENESSREPAVDSPTQSSPLPGLVPASFTSLETQLPGLDLALLSGADIASIDAEMPTWDASNLDQIANNDADANFETAIQSLADIGSNGVGNFDGPDMQAVFNDSQDFGDLGSSAAFAGEFICSGDFAGGADAVAILDAMQFADIGQSADSGFIAEGGGDVIGYVPSGGDDGGA